MTVKDIGKQVKDVIDSGTAQIKDEGKKVARKVKATVEATRSLGLKKLGEIIGELRPQDLMNRFGSLTLNELIERLRNSEITRHADVVRQEVLAFLRLPTLEDIEKLQARLDKVAKEVSDLKALKTEVKNLAKDVKALKTASKEAQG